MLIPYGIRWILLFGHKVIFMVITHLLIYCNSMNVSNSRTLSARAVYFAFPAAPFDREDTKVYLFIMWIHVADNTLRFWWCKLSTPISKNIIRYTNLPSKSFLNYTWVRYFSLYKKIKYREILGKIFYDCVQLFYYERFKYVFS